MPIDLSKVGRRGELKAQREPHWQRLRANSFLGFRPSQRGGPGTWIARAYDPDAGKYKLKSLGDFGTLAGNEMFAAAKKEAETFADLVESGGIAQARKKIETVADACRDYAETHDDAKGRFVRYVYSDPIGKTKLDKLRRHHLDAWRARLAAAPALVSRSKGDEQRTRARSPATVNRDMVPLRAALSKLLAPGAPGTPAAWQEALKPIKNADKQRTLYLDHGQRRKLVEHVDGEAAPFVRCLCQLPLRPGAVANLSAGDFDKRTR